MSVLSEHDIRRLVKQDHPLIEGYINLDEQVQPNGFELTLRDIAAYKNSGQIARSNKDRVLPDLTTLPFGADGFIFPLEVAPVLLLAAILGAIVIVREK